MKILVAGGGASGMVAAIVASRNGHEVTVLEHKDRPGKKILATGNGRCNLSNSLLKDAPGQYYRNIEGDSRACDFINDLFGAFSYDDTIAFFESLGLWVKAKGNLMYPYSEQAGAVLDVLRFALRDLGINVITDCKVEDICKMNSGKFEITAELSRYDDKDKKTKLSTEKVKYTADRVIIATGSKAQPKLGADGSGYSLLKKLGHTITDVTPALVQLVAKKDKGQDIFKSLAGVRTHAIVELCIDNKPVAVEDCELQLTAYGISGIGVMNLTTYLGNQDKNISVNVDLAPEYKEDKLYSMLDNKCYQNPNRMSEELLIGFLPKKLSEAMLKLSTIGFTTKYADISDDKLKKLVRCIKRWKIDIEGTNTFDDAQICMGGLPVDELKDTLESRIVPGLYVAGEIIDAHGPCGGFNLQQAWSTGAVAGMLK